MLFARVLAPVVLSHAHERYMGEKLVVVQPLDANERSYGSEIVAVDRVSSRVGDKVLILREGSGIRQILGRDAGLSVDQAIVESIPIRSMVIALVDDIF